MLLLWLSFQKMDLDLCTITLDSCFDEGSPSQDEVDPYDADMSSSFVPSVSQRPTEVEAVRHIVHDQGNNQQPQAMPWPTTGRPLSEFTTEGYLTCAFPTLFPTGSADFLAPRVNAVTIGRYFKHLMMYDDWRFSTHPRFRYLAFNTVMRWRALQTGRVYVNQHPDDARLTVDELQVMVGHQGDTFSNRVLHYASSLRGTRQYWFKQRSRLIAMVDTLGIPTVFFTHSAADHQWPELARLLTPDDPNSSSSRTKAVIENPAVSDWFFSCRIQKYIETYYVGIMNVADYWFRFEWQHRGSPHVHGVAWIQGAPDAEQVLASPDNNAKQHFIEYMDKIVNTMNPGVLPDGSDMDSAPPPQVNPHICNLPYAEVQNFDEDLISLVATCQRHTRCSASYCLRTSHGEQKCRFGYPKPLQPATTIATEDDEPVVMTARNDGLINSYNPIQLSGWHANVDIQYIVSRKRVLNYCAKYATKCEPRSQTLKDIFTAIVRSLKDDTASPSVKTVQKLLISTVGDRDYCSQEVIHLLLEIPLFRLHCAQLRRVSSC